jgi:hypothetical protein
MCASLERFLKHDFDGGIEQIFSYHQVASLNNIGDIITYDQEIVMVIKNSVKKCSHCWCTVKHISTGWHNRTL